MNCDKCQAAIREGDSHEHAGRTLCDDCYMDALSPTRSCDPWAIHSAKRLEQSGSQQLQINDTQKRILKYLEDFGESEQPTIAKGLGLDLATLQREMASLRHMERIRGRNIDGRIVMRLWGND